MIENTLKRLLQRGGTAIGTMVCDTRNPAIARALAESEGVRGKAVTPFLLRRVSELSGGASLKADLALLINNARVAARLAAALAKDGSQKGEAHVAS